MKLINEEFIKWVGIVERSRFKAVNTGRTYPIPMLWIKVGTANAFESLRHDIGCGKRKMKNNQLYLVLGPNCLRMLIPIVHSSLKNNAGATNIIKEWLDLLTENKVLHNKDLVVKNRLRISELREALIKVNIASRKSNIAKPGVVIPMVSILRLNLNRLTQIPVDVRTDFQKMKIIDYMESIAKMDPTGPEAIELGDNKHE